MLSFLKKVIALDVKGFRDGKKKTKFFAPMWLKNKCALGSQILKLAREVARVYDWISTLMKFRSLGPFLGGPPKLDNGCSRT